MNKRQAKKIQHLEDIIESTGLACYHKKHGTYKYIRKYERWFHEQNIRDSRKPIVCTPNYWGEY